MVCGHGELMIQAGELQAEHKLDIAWDLKPLLEKSEKFRKYTGED